MAASSSISPLAKYKLVFLGDQVRRESPARPRAAQQRSSSHLGVAHAFLRSVAARAWARRPLSRASSTTSSTAHTRFAAASCEAWVAGRLAPALGLVAKLFLSSALPLPQATIGIDFLSKTMYLEDRTVRLQLWCVRRCGRCSVNPRDRNCALCLQGHGRPGALQVAHSLLHPGQFSGGGSLRRV